MSSNQSCQNLGECQFMGEGMDKRGGVIDIVYMRTVLNMKILMLMCPTIRCIIFALRLPSELKLYLVTCYFPLFCRCYPHKLFGVAYSKIFSSHCTSWICVSCMFYYCEISSKKAVHDFFIFYSIIIEEL